MDENCNIVLQRLKPLGFCAVDVVAKATTYTESCALAANPKLGSATRLDGSEESRSLSASRARQTVAGKKKRGTTFGMTRVVLFRGNLELWPDEKLSCAGTHYEN